MMGQITGDSYFVWRGVCGADLVFLTHQALFYHMDIKPRYSSISVL